jgi:predicted dinucleotide-binding enzyme
MSLGIATRLVAAGEHVTVLGTTAEKSKALAEKLGAAGQNGTNVRSGTVSDSITDDIVVLAVPYSAALEIVEQRGRELAGKVVVDITNPVDWDSMERLVAPPGSSGAQEIADRAHPEAKVVKAFNLNFANTLVEGRLDDRELDVLIAGDDEDAKATLTKLVEGSDLRPIDVGPLRRARQLEELGFLHISIQGSLGTGFRSALMLHW